MTLPTAVKDELRLDVPAGTVRLSIQDRPILLLRRPTVGELIRLLEEYERLTAEVYNQAEWLVGDDGKRRHPFMEGMSQADGLRIGARWLSAVIFTITGELIDDAEMPAWASTSTIVFQALTSHWFEVPLAFGGSVNGSEPEPPPVTLPPSSMSPEPVILRQAILGDPAPG